MNALHMLVLLVAGHYLADYPLQGEFLATQKNPWLDASKRLAPWYQALGAHAAIHAGVVLLITGSVTLAGMELIAHTAIDAGKCAGKFSFNTDQAIHFSCKVAWVALLSLGIGVGK